MQFSFNKSLRLAATELRQSFSDRQPVQEGKFSGRFGAELSPHLAGGLVELSHQQVCLCDLRSAGARDGMWPLC